MRRLVGVMMGRCLKQTPLSMRSLSKRTEVVGILSAWAGDH